MWKKNFPSDIRSSSCHCSLLTTTYKQKIPVDFLEKIKRKFVHRYRRRSSMRRWEVSSWTLLRRERLPCPIPPTVAKRKFVFEDRRKNHGGQTGQKCDTVRCSKGRPFAELMIVAATECRAIYLVP